MEAEEVQLECRQVTIGYERELVVKDLSFQVKQGDYLSIIGQNGTGKSSLLKAILGLIRPKSGEIIMNHGVEKKNIGYLSQQNPSQKDFPASVYEVVLSGCLNQKGLLPFYSQQEKKRAKSNLEKLGMSQLLHESFADLSGGQKQRVLLARALCATDKMIFLDEPITGLDPAAMKEMYELIAKLNQEMGITIVMVTHDIENAMKYSKNILCLRKDDYFFGSTKDFLASDFRMEV